ncbi:hypothetical protein [Xanthovirga aplysinae]|uniref:hypothetical protein n=1 Tax=Xanthovirga aplysinae TaxID=2529853 RepID=UPI0012BCA6ED|nr:hypothetical protein [Xanthovirga aplysinae]MTI32729.1 hypothetical protein [Xanthovirga aplysinae]
MKGRRVLLKVLMGVGGAFIFSSCATIFHGSTTKINVQEGYPSNAEVYYNGSYMGKAPVSFEITDGIAALDNRTVNLDENYQGDEDFSTPFGRTKVKRTEDSQVSEDGGNMSSQSEMIRDRGVVIPRNKVTLKSEGFYDQEVTLGKKLRVGSLILDFLFTGPIGLIVDFGSGAIYKQFPNLINYRLKERPEGEVSKVESEP